VYNQIPLFHQQKISIDAVSAGIEAVKEIQHFHLKTTIRLSKCFLVMTHVVTNFWKSNPHLMTYRKMVNWQMHIQNHNPIKMNFLLKLFV